MSSEGFSQFKPEASDLIPKILESRDQYQPCHIRVPDLDQRLAAIRVNGKYYSLLKLVKSRQEALDITMRLSHRGDATIITATKKGDAIWVLEREAYPETLPQPPSPSQPSNAATTRILESRSEYQPCHIRVPDLEHRLPAISVDGKYYSLFRVVKDRKQALEITARLARRKDESVITKTARGDVIWVLEPEAQLERNL